MSQFAAFLASGSVLLGAVGPAAGIDFSQFPADIESHDTSRIVEVAPGVYSTFASSNPDWQHHLRQLILDTNQPNPSWRLQGHWPVGQEIPGFAEWTRGWWEEYGYDYENQVGHLEVAAVAPTQIDDRTVYFNMRNLPGWEFAIENDLEPAMFMGLYRATATGDWPNQTWAMDPLPIYYSDGFTWEQGGPRAVDAQVWDDRNGKRYLTFGSWDPANRNVIAIAELDKATGRIAGKPADEPVYYDPNDPALTTLATFGEAAAVYQRSNNDYYLFLNLGACCSGVDSTYEIVVGRSDSPTGPFVDRQGGRFDAAYPETPKTAGSFSTDRFPGTSVLAGEGRFVGPGHAGFFEQADGSLTMSFHYYDRDAAGQPKMGTRQIVFDAAGWPLAATPTAGDFNADGRVDNADFTEWALQYGRAKAAGVFGRYSADANADGRVDAADYTLWRDNVAPRTEAAGIPEPATAAMVVSVLAAAGGTRPR